MTHEQLTRAFRERIRQARRDFLEMLDWVETELDHIDAEAQHADGSGEDQTENDDQDDREEEPLTDRHHWIMAQLREGKKLRKADAMAEFKLGSKQTSRILQSLINRGLIEFCRRPKPGHYVLRTKPTPASRRAIATTDEVQQEPAKGGTGPNHTT